MLIISSKFVTSHAAENDTTAETLFWSGLFPTTSRSSPSAMLSGRSLMNWLSTGRPPRKRSESVYTRLSVAVRTSKGTAVGPV